REVRREQQLRRACRFDHAEWAAVQAGDSRRETLAGGRRQPATGDGRRATGDVVLFYVPPPPPPLPIDAALPDLAAALGRGTSAVLQAPPGAGKTTGVPPALLAAPWVAEKKIIMLEPRRLATRAAARRMSHLLGQHVGGVVGFRVRGETRASGATRIEAVTEGILTRMLQSDPSLDGVGLVIFDEFHERSLDADLALALTLETRDVLRPDLRVLVMSATLDGARVARLLGDAPVITSEG